MRGSSFIVLLALALGCGKSNELKPNAPAPPNATAPISTPERAEAAKALFEKAASDFHNPSADATGDQKTKLLEGAAKRYEQLLRDAENKTEAKAYYQKIVTRFDRKEIPPVYKIILNISEKRAGG